jgi:hypothetical protein
MAYGITNEIKHDAGLSPMIANDRPIEWTTGPPFIYSCCGNFAKIHQRLVMA